MARLSDIGNVKKPSVVKSIKHLILHTLTSWMGSILIKGLNHGQD